MMLAILNCALCQHDYCAFRCAKQINESDLSELIEDVAGALQQDLPIISRALVFCGLNPHAGENGAMGDEEQRILMPAIKHASDKLDGSYHLALIQLIRCFIRKKKLIDCIIGMYHDQV